MANSEHVAQLMKGVDAWNLWRNQHPNIQPDLAKAELQSRITSAGTLEFADVSGADLRWAYRSGAQWCLDAGAHMARIKI